MNKNKKESFYILDFLKTLMNVRKIPIIIYLLFDVLFAFVGFMILFGFFASFFASNSGSGVSEATTVWAVIISIVVYVGAMILSLSPIGEWFLRWKLKCDDIEEQEILNRVLPLFNEVYSKAKNLIPSLSEDIKLFIQENSEDEVNAFAVGRRSICITRGLLNLSDEQIKAILAHEFGHLAHKDTDLNLVVNVANMFINLILTVFWVILLVYKIICVVLSFFMRLAGESAGAATGKIFELIFAFLAFVLINVIRYLWNMLGNLLIKFASRGSEFDADEFAFNLGYGEPLVEFFKTLPDAVEGKKISIKSFKMLKKTLEALGTIGATHPQTYKRIARLQKLLGTQEHIEVISESKEPDFTELS